VYEAFYHAVMTVRFKDWVGWGCCTVTCVVCMVGECMFLGDQDADVTLMAYFMF